MKTGFSASQRQRRARHTWCTRIFSVFPTELVLLRPVEGLLQNISVYFAQLDEGDVTDASETF